MSTKSTIFLTNDNEHCYYECSLPHHDENGEYIGSTIVLEMSKKNTDLVTNDDEYIIVEIKPGNDLYDVFKFLSHKPFYKIFKLLNDLEEWEKVNHIDDDLLNRIKQLKKECEVYF